MIGTVARRQRPLHSVVCGKLWNRAVGGGFLMISAVDNKASPQLHHKRCTSSSAAANSLFEAMMKSVKKNNTAVVTEEEIDKAFNVNTILESDHVRLEPLTLDHVPLLANVHTPETTQYFCFPIGQGEEGMRAWVQTALNDAAKGIAIPFATVHKPSGRVVGSTRFGNIRRAHRGVEIGWTWISPAWQHTEVNTEAKYLMLEHAFERMRCIRVEFLVDSLNEKSKKAVLRIGAKQDGILRNHMVTASGRIRHNVIYSILDSEWPDVRTNLRTKMAIKQVEQIVPFCGKRKNPPPPPLTPTELQQLQQQQQQQR